MHLVFAPQITPDEQASFQRILSRFPNEWQVHIAHNLPNLYILWFKRGSFCPFVELWYQGGPLEDYTEELQGWFYKLEKAFQAWSQENPRAETENPRWVTQEEMDAIRKGDFERTMSPRELQERLDKGLLPGLEHLKDLPSIRSLKTRPERLAHDKGLTH